MYILDGIEIRNPHRVIESNSTQYAAHRVLSGRNARDYFGDNKRVWVLQFRNCNPADYATIKAIYTSYMDTNTTKSWEITETNYDVDETFVHIDVPDRDFNVRGADYLSDFDVILTEE